MSVKIVAFDAKSIQRTKREWSSDGTVEEKTRVFLSQLGIGVTVPEPGTFAKEYVEASQDLRTEFGLDYATPFFSSTCLRNHLDIFEAADFANRLVSRMHSDRNKDPIIAATCLDRVLGTDACGLIVADA